MCTAITFSTKDHYFGRNLDLECSLNEQVIIAPRRFPFSFRNGTENNRHAAIIGMGIIVNGYPLFYDATNEDGLSMAGLNFPQKAVYHNPRDGFHNIAPFEFMPWLLCHCKTVNDAKKLLANTNITLDHFSDDISASPLHWIVADRECSITVESVTDGLRVYDNTVGVLTNSPCFDYHMQNLENYLNLTSDEPTNRFSKHLNLTPYSLGMGGIGLPGDLSSASRFVRAVFTKLNSRCEEYESSSVSQFFHILGSVEQTDGCTKTGEHYERTVYSSCCNTDQGIYYYTTYGNRQISAVSLYSENLDCCDLVPFPLITEQQIRWINK